MSKSKMPPKRDGENLEQRGVGLTPSQWAELEELSKLRGHNNLMAELRQCMIIGMTAEKQELSKALDYENKQLLNRKLKNRQGEMEQALDELAALLGGTNPEALALIEKLKGYLHD